MTLSEALNVQEPLSLEAALRLFNRKERNWLFRDAMGPAAEHLGEDFRKRVEDAVREKDDGFRLSPNAYWATDYHLNWLVAVLQVLADGFQSVERPCENKLDLIKGNQEDIDLVIASDRTLLLIEVKGEGAWTTKQMKSKAARLQALSPTLIDYDGKAAAGSIDVRFLLCSPRQPQKLKTDGWPDWAKAENRPLYFELHPPAERFAKTQRCNVNSRKAATGGFWHVVPSSR